MAMQPSVLPLPVLLTSHWKDANAMRWGRDSSYADKAQDAAEMSAAQKPPKSQRVLMVPSRCETLISDQKTPLQQGLCASFGVDVDEHDADGYSDEALREVGSPHVRVFTAGFDRIGRMPQPSFPRNLPGDLYCEEAELSRKILRNHAGDDLPTIPELPEFQHPSSSSAASYNMSSASPTQVSAESSPVARCARTSTVPVFQREKIQERFLEGTMVTITSVSL